eukprot:11171655-Lingulodinium_polyedra.AAC.1
MELVDAMQKRAGWRPRAPAEAWSRWAGRGANRAADFLVNRAMDAAAMRGLDRLEPGAWSWSHPDQ